MTSAGTRKIPDTLRCRGQNEPLLSRVLSTLAYFTQTDQLTETSMRLASTRACLGISISSTPLV